MKTQGCWCALAVLGAAGLSLAGPLDPPPGPVAPTHKTLTDVEPRTVINAVNTPGDADATPSLYKITQSGSYYLTGNLNGVAGKIGIEITASRVTIDLCGFALQGVPGTLSGIRAPVSVTGVTVRNGTVSAWGANGIDLYDAHACRVEAVTAIGNGGTGLRAGWDCVITNCTARSNTGSGINGGPGARISDCSAAQNGQAGLYGLDGSTIAGCAARNNGDDGIQVNGTASFLNCTATGNAGSGITGGFACTYTGCSARENQADGFWVNYASTATSCAASENGRDGFFVWSGSVSNCVATANARDGIRLDSGNSSAIGNQCHGNFAGAGIRAVNSACRIDSNQVMDNSFGIVAVADCVVVRNSARANSSANYSFPGGSEYGQIITNPGGAFVASNPWANFAY